MSTLLNTKSSKTIHPVVFCDLDNFSSFQLFEKYVRAIIPDYKKDEYVSTFGWGASFGGQQTSILQNITMRKNSCSYTFRIYNGHITYFEVEFHQEGFYIHLNETLEVFLPLFKENLDFKEYKDFQELMEIIIPIISHVYYSQMIKDGYVVDGVIQ